MSVLVRIMVIAFGLILLAAGGMELKLRMKSSDTPTDYSIKVLEGGGVVSNLNGNIDGHFANYEAMVFSYRGMASESEAAPKEDQLVDRFWYPVYSSRPSPDGDLPPFRVVVSQNQRGLRVRNLPRGIAEMPPTKGMFLIGFHALDGKERALLQEAFPKIDFDNILLFDANRDRGSLTKIGGLAGVGLLIVCLATFFWKPRPQGNGLTGTAGSGASSNGAPG